MRVLVVDPCAERRAPLSREAARLGHAVVEAADLSAALVLCEEHGPFGCVLADHELGEPSGIELLARIAERWPDSSRVLVTGLDTLDVAIEALHAGRILRLLRRPFQEDALCAALAAAAEQFELREHERRWTEELAFSREALLGMLEVLERRLCEEVRALEGVHELSQRLEAARSLEDVAVVAAQALSRALGGRPTRVEFANPQSGGAAVVAADAGPLAEAQELERIELGGAAPAIYLPRDRGLTGRDGRLISPLLSSVSLAARGQRHRIERDEAQHATVFALARLAEQRDNETGQHLERVSAYCRLVALGLRSRGSYAAEISDLFVSDLARSAPLHDIGKVGIPDEILLKPGKLDAAEWTVMKRHTVIGGDTLRSVIENTANPGFLRMGHDVALYHHERWDGGGYPFGLSGPAIPLGARILAMADVYDALTTRRPYKEAWPHARALEWIASESAKHFDPAVCSVFLDHAKEADEIRRLHPDEDTRACRAF